MGTLLTKDEILTQENRLYNAVRTADLVELDELLHDDLLFILPGGTVISKEDDLNTYRSGKLKIDTLCPDIENLRIIEDSAVITLTLRLKGSFDGASFEAAYRYIRFWKQFPEGIKVIGGSGSAV